MSRHVRGEAASGAQLRTRAQVGIPVPDVMVINVGGATGDPSPGDPADGEFALDMQVILLRQGAKAVLGIAAACHPVTETLLMRTQPRLSGICCEP